MKRKMIKRGMAVATAVMLSASVSGMNLPVYAATESDSTGTQSQTDQSGTAGNNMGTPPDGTGGSSMGTPPDGTGGNNMGTLPDGTDGSSMGTPPDGTGGSSMGTPPDGTDGNSMGTPPDGMGGNGMGGANTTNFDYSGSFQGSLTANGTVVTSDGETIGTTDTDVNAALSENGGSLRITNGTLTKDGSDSNGDNCNFYGLNSILLSVGTSSLAAISGSTLSAVSEGSNGIFATNGGTVYANQDTIQTTADNSRGLDATYSGTILANQMQITTQGNHCAALATDRGGGSVSVTDSTFSTAGSGSPLLYSTGDIEVSDCTGTASGSQIAGMEGLNTILINHSTLTSTVTKASASDPVADAVILYQSTSGDAETTTGSSADFEAADSTLTSSIASGAFFYCTNTTANVVLSNTSLVYDSDQANLLTIAGNDSNSWGTAGKNGASVTFTGLQETLSGNIAVDTISSLQLYLLSGTTYTGSTSITENAVNTNATDAPITVNLDNSSSWIVTGNSTVTNLNAEKGASIVDAEGRAVTIAVNGTTVVSGTSPYTITVTGSYSNTVSTGSENQLTGTQIDRSAFDSYYGSNTAYTFGSSQSGSSTAGITASAASASALSQSGTMSQTVMRVILAAVIVAAAAAAGFVLRKKHRS